MARSPNRSRSESVTNWEFRLEAYNLTNSLMWANPNLTPGNSLFGRSTQQAVTNRGREMQYTLRLMF
jgi:hypothetical protein